MCDLLAFFGESHLLAQFELRPPLAQLRAHAGQQLDRLAGAGEHVVGAQVEPAGALGGATGGQKDDADILGGRGALEARQQIAAVELGNIGIEYQEIDARGNLFIQPARPGPEATTS